MPPGTGPFVSYVVDEHRILPVCVASNIVLHAIVPPFADFLYVFTIQRVLQHLHIINDK